MSFTTFGFGDFITVAKVAWDLYHKCYLVAKDAPSEFRQLVDELCSLQGVLRSLRDELNAPDSYLHMIDESRKSAIERTVDGTFRTLKELDLLVRKYQGLGSSDGLQVWKRIKWITHQRDIDGYRAKIMMYTCCLSLSMSSVGNSTLHRMENDFTDAFKRQPQSTVVDGDQPHRRSSTASHLTDRTNVSQGDYDSPITSPGSSPLPADRPSSVSSSVPPNVQRVSPRRSVDSGTDDLIDLMSDDEPGSDVESVWNVIQRAGDLLSNCRDRDSVLRPPVPLHWDPPNPKNLVSDAIAERFLANIGRQTGSQRITTKDLLRTGTWWILKSRNAVRLQNSSSLPNESCASSNETNCGLYQAYLDLMKASWILYNYVLADPAKTIAMTDEDIKSFSALQDAIDEDFEAFRLAGFAVEDFEGMALNDKIWEVQQPRERTYDTRDYNPLLDPCRWFTIEESHAGSDHEEAHLRVFVNAELGGKEVRLKTRDARYMLVVWAKEGESEPKISLCNQSGSLKVSRDITPDDIRKCSVGSGAAKVPPALDFDFLDAGMGATIHFLHFSDYEAFVAIPTRFFNAVQERNPTSGNETPIYRAVLNTFEILYPNTTRPIHPHETFRSVELRVYETTGEEDWMTTRRLVLSSSAGAAQPWCTSYFLPLSRVQIKCENQQQLTVKWSDCSQRTVDTKGEFTEYISYVYDEHKPNKCISLLFASSDDAMRFQEVILKLTLSERYRWDSPSESRYIYSIRSAIDDTEKYKGVVITKRRLEWKYSEAYYLPRDMDFEVKDNGLSVRFLGAYCTHYLSDHVDRLYDLEAGDQPKFSRCKKFVESISLSFESDEDTQQFLRYICAKWELKFARKVTRITYKDSAPSFFPRSNGTKHPVDLSLWQKGDVQRLLIRQRSSSGDTYMTTDRPDTFTPYGTFNRDSEKASFPNLDLTSGCLVDVVTMTAVSPKRIASAVKRGQTLTIAFSSVKDKEAFADVSKLLLP